MDNFYVTTPIYYVNDKPHIGHAYTTILADVMSRYARSSGRDTFFLTGTDEHGQKVQKAAAARQMPEQQHCDETVVRFQELWKKLGITNDRFIRTTYDFHKKVVSGILQELYDRGEIYKAEYVGHYCVGDERFFTEKDLVDGKCPECGREVVEIVESNYFFRMGKYREWLIDYIETHPGFIQPSFRANETLGFLRKELGDLCISRPKSRLSWGIELPFDRDYVCYVWFDALINYISGVGYRQDDETFSKWWPASYHLIGKDILTTHTVYWPTMLKAIGLPMPKAIFAHGWWLTGKAKMSKSLGNVVDPMAMVEKYGVDAFRYFLMTEMTPGQDASFTEEAFVRRYNSDLANDLGNMASRVLNMVRKNCGGVIPEVSGYGEAEKALLADFDAAAETMTRSLDGIKLDQGINAVMGAIRSGNRYLENTAPWSLAKKGETEKLALVLNTASEGLRRAAVLLSPVMPEKMAQLAALLGMGEDYTAKTSIADLADKRVMVGGRSVSPEAVVLFPRAQLEEEAASEAAKPEKGEKNARPKDAKTEKKSAPEALPGVVTIDEFARTQLKVAKVLTAEKVEGADKLLRLSIDLGGETRQIVAGVAQFYSPEEITGRLIVVVANLKPAKVRGIESNGMLLAAKSGNELKLVSVAGDIAPGAIVG